MIKKVLLVDDEVDLLQSLAEHLRHHGVKASIASSPRVAIRKFEREPCDIVILDLIMPEMDGLEVLHTLKEKNPEVQVILLTGHATIEKGIEAMKGGAVDLLEKPVDLGQLIEKIKKARMKKLITEG
jgi:DNA-binding NtrC family response regulator